MFTLKKVMQANSVSCLLFGLLFLFCSQQVAHFLSDSNPAPNDVVSLIGVVLIINGLHLLWASWFASSNQCLVAYFSIGDCLWVLTSILLIVTHTWVTSPIGIIATVVVAIMVAIYGYIQWVEIKKIAEANLMIGCCFD